MKSIRGRAPSVTGFTVTRARTILTMSVETVQTATPTILDTAFIHTLNIGIASLSNQRSVLLNIRYQQVVFPASTCALTTCDLFLTKAR